MLIETVDDTSNRPIAIESGFFSGFASATIFPKDEIPCGLFGKTLDSIDECDFSGLGSGVFMTSVTLFEKVPGLVSLVLLNRDCFPPQIPWGSCIRMSNGRLDAGSNEGEHGIDGATKVRTCVQTNLACTYSPSGDTVACVATDRICGLSTAEPRAHTPNIISRDEGREGIQWRIFNVDFEITAE
jgi:hypothetical protein